MNDLAVSGGTVADEADVIVVGAGPGGSAAAYHMARHGLRVLLLEKTEFPREKVCGDGLTPRATRQLIRMGVDTSEKAGWLPASRAPGRGRGSAGATSPVGWLPCTGPRRCKEWAFARFGLVRGV